MLSSFQVVLLIVGCCVALYWCRDWIPRAARRPVRGVAFAAALLALAVCAVGAAGNASWPAVRVAAPVAVPATVALIACAPSRSRRLLPLALAALGLLGLVLALSGTSFANPAGTVLVVSPAGLWRVALVLQSAALLAAGLWLIGAAEAPGLTTRVLRGQPRWNLLLPPVLATLAAMLFTHVAHAAWIAVAAVAVITLCLVFLFPRVAADLTAAGLVAAGLAAIRFATSQTLVLVNALATPASAGARQGPAPDFATVGAPLVLLAAVQGAAILVFGLWLVPRTITPHLRALLRLQPDAELAGRVQQLTQTRADAVDSAAAELRRVERDLHDGAQARLVALGMNLRAAERLVYASPQAAVALIAEARESSARALTELRGLVRGIYPPVLADRGLADAVRALALDTPIRTETDIDLPGRADAPVESACYFAVAEALANAVKHASARLVQVRIRYQPAPGGLRIEVTDDGVGGADPAKGTGLHGVERRLGTFDGILAVSSPPGGPTMIIIEVPCALSSPRISSC